MTVVERVTTPTESGRPGTIGTSPTRPDGVAKVQGQLRVLVGSVR